MIDIEYFIELVENLNIDYTSSCLDKLEKNLIKDHNNIFQSKIQLRKNHKPHILKILNNVSLYQDSLYNKNNIFKDNFIENIQVIERKIGNCPKISKKERCIYEFLNKVSDNLQSIHSKL